VHGAAELEVTSEGDGQAGDSAQPEDVRQQIIASGQLVVESEELTPEIVASSDILYLRDLGVAREGVHDNHVALGVLEQSVVDDKGVLETCFS
jgi:hypothetical protein